MQLQTFLFVILQSLLEKLCEEKNSKLLRENNTYLKEFLI